MNKKFIRKTTMAKRVNKDSSLTDSRLRALREKVIEMSDKGVTSAEIARRLHLKPMQVAAYIAHQTMGTYGH